MFYSDAEMKIELFFSEVGYSTGTVRHIASGDVDKQQLDSLQ